MKHKIITLSACAVAWIAAVALFVGSVGDLDRPALRSTQDHLRAAATAIESAVGRWGVGLDRRAAELAANKDLANALNKYVAALNTVKPNTDPLPFQQARIDKAAQQLDEQREAFRGAHPVLSGVALVNDVGLVMHSDSELFAHLQSVSLGPSAGTSSAITVPASPPTRRKPDATGAAAGAPKAGAPKPNGARDAPRPAAGEAEASPAPPPTFMQAVLAGASGTAVTVAKGGVFFVGAAPIFHPVNKKKVIGAVLVDRKLTTLPAAAPAPDALLFVEGQVVLGAVPEGFVEPEPPIPAEPFLAAPRDPPALLGGFSLPFPSFLGGERAPGLWAQRFAIPGTQTAWGYVVTDTTDLYGELRGVALGAVLLALFTYAGVAALVLTDGLGLRRGIARLADFLGDVHQGRTQARSIPEGSVPPEARRLARLINQTLEHYVGGSVQPLPRSPSVDDVLEATKRDAVVETPDDAPSFNDLSFEGISNAGTLDVSKLPTGDMPEVPDGAGPAWPAPQADEVTPVAGEATFASLEPSANRGAPPPPDADGSAGEEDDPTFVGSPEGGELPPPFGFDADEEGAQAPGVEAEAEVLEAGEADGAEELQDVADLEAVDAVEEVDAEAVEDAEPDADLDELPPPGEAFPAPQPPRADSQTADTTIMQMTPEVLAQLRKDVAAAAPPSPPKPSVSATAETAVMKLSPQMLAQMRPEDTPATPAPAPMEATSSTAETKVVKLTPEMMAEVRGRAAQDPEAEARRARDAHFRETFDAFVETRKRCGEGGELVYEKFARRLEETRAAVMQKHACSDVRFAVYVKNGKAALKATPK